jgi:hypothetical protein
MSLEKTIFFAGARVVFYVGYKNGLWRDIVAWSLLLFDPLIQSDPSTGAGAAGCANLELVDRVNLPERNAFRISFAGSLAVAAREVTRIEIELAGHTYL